jgi:PilZ domain-containing protein
MLIYRFLIQEAFEQAEINAIASAYEAALKLLQLTDENDPLCEAVAKIMDVARNGARDAAHICTRALKELGISLPERRGATRLRTLKGGSILFGTAAAIDCVIRNMSERGASLEVESPIGIPDDFALLIKPETIIRNCHVMWRTAKRIGVRFVQRTK